MGMIKAREVAWKPRAERLDISPVLCTLALSMRSILAAVAVAVGLTGCTKMQARDLIREGNAHYGDGQYVEAIEAYTQAVELEPDGVTVFWNRACAAESLVLKIKDPKRLEERRKFADQSLKDFKTWLDRLEAPEDKDREEYEKHRLVLLKADERCDDLLTYWLGQHNENPNEEALYTRIAKQYEECGRTKDADEWFVKRTEDFPDSPRAFVSLAIRTFDPLWPDPESGEQYNMALDATERLEIANKVIRTLDRATRLDPKFREAYTWRAMAYNQRSLSHPYSDDPEAQTLEEKLNVILTREDSLEAWKQQKALCDIDQIPECDVGKSLEEQGQCCMLPPRPISIEEQAADAEQKALILQQIEDAKGDAVVEENKKKKKKRKGR